MMPDRVPGFRRDHGAAERIIAHLKQRVDRHRAIQRFYARLYKSDPRHRDN